LRGFPGSSLSGTLCELRGLCCHSYFGPRTCGRSGNQFNWFPLQLNVSKETLLTILLLAVFLFSGFLAFCFLLVLLHMHCFHATARAILGLLLVAVALTAAPPDDIDDDEVCCLSTATDRNGTRTLESQLLKLRAWHTRPFPSPLSPATPPTAPSPRTPPCTFRERPSSPFPRTRSRSCKLRSYAQLLERLLRRSQASDRSSAAGAPRKTTSGRDRYGGADAFGGSNAAVGYTAKSRKASSKAEYRPVFSKVLSWDSTDRIHM